MILPALLLVLLLFSGTHVPLGADTVVSFAPSSRGAELLSRRDSHISGMSLFDRQSRLGTSKPVTEQEVRDLFRSSVLDWSPEERIKVSGRLRALAPLLARFRLPFPPEIVLIKTSGREEGGALYTRGNAVVLTEDIIRKTSDEELDRLLLHELFHVLSRHSPEITEALYRAIGFRPCGILRLPACLAERRISNPDVTDITYAVRVRYRGRDREVAPIVYSSGPYDVAKGGTFFRYMKLGLLEVERSGETCLPVAREGKIELLKPADVQGYFEQVGKNTGYVSDPQEILADNFVLLMLGRTELPSPEITARMAEIFARGAESLPSSQADRR